MATRDSGRGRSRDFEPATIKVITPPIRLSYAKLFDPIKNDQGKDVWETDALIPPKCYYPKNHPDFPEMHLSEVLLETMEKVMNESFGHEDEWPRGRNDYHPKDKLKYLDPDNLPGKGVDENWEKFSARSYQPVGIVDADKEDVFNKREVYGGRWAKLSLTIATYDNKGSKGVTIYLNNVQLLDHDDSFGGRPSANADFDRYDGPELAPGGRRDRDRDDDRRGGRDDEDDRGRGRGRGARDDDGGRDRGGSREDRGGGRDRDRSGDRRDSRGRDDGASRGRGRDDDRGRDRDDRDSGGDRGRSRGRDREEADDRDDSRGRSSSRDRDDRDRSSSREAEEGEGRRGGRGRGRDDDERGGDRSRGRGRGDDREDDERGGGRDRGGSRDSSRGRSRDDDDQEERPSSRGGRGSRDDDRDWN